MYNRSAFKQEAKQLIRASVPHFMLVSLVYYLLTSGLSTAVSWLVGEFSTPNNPSGGVLGIFLTILVALFSAVMGIGFVNYSLRLARREPTGWSSLFQGFSYAGRAIGLTLMLTLFICLWGLLIIIGVVIVAVILIIPAVYSPIFLPITVIGVICLYIGEIAVLWLILLRYSMAEFALVDNPDIGVMESIRRSIRMMRGYKWKLFVMHLSFLGWELLVALITLIVVTIGFFAGGAASMLDLIPATEDPEVIYRWSMALMDRLKYWVLLGSVLALPLSLWLLVYKQTALARFYNYVGGYDYHQYMNACQAQAGSSAPTAPTAPTAPPVQSAPEPPRPVQPPIGGYYTPQPDVSEPPVQPETPIQPEAPAEPESPVQPEAPEQPEPPSGLPAQAPETSEDDADEEDGSEDETEEI